MLLSAVEHEVSDTGLLQSGHTEQRAEAEVLYYFSRVISLINVPCDDCCGVWRILIYLIELFDSDLVATLSQNNLVSYKFYLTFVRFIMMHKTSGN